MKYKIGDQVVVKGKIKDIYEDRTNNIEIQFTDQSSSCFNVVHVCRNTSRDADDLLQIIRRVLLPIQRGGHTMTELNSIFSTHDVQKILNLPASEILSRYEEYEKNYIRVGDKIVVRTGAGEEMPGVVTQVTHDQNCICVLYVDGSTGMTTKNNVTKLGTSIDIESVLNEIRR